jgi:hypothetical protein
MGSVSLSVRVRQGTIEYFASRVFMSHCLNFEDAHLCHMVWECGTRTKVELS